MGSVHLVLTSRRPCSPWPAGWACSPRAAVPAHNRRPVTENESPHESMFLQVLFFCSWCYTPPWQLPANSLPALQTSETTRTPRRNFQSSRPQVYKQHTQKRWPTTNTLPGVHAWPRDPPVPFRKHTISPGSLLPGLPQDSCPSRSGWRSRSANQGGTKGHHRD